MPSEAPKAPLSPEQEQQRADEFEKLRVATRQYNGRAITPAEFATMQGWVDEYKTKFNVGDPVLRSGNQSMKQGQLVDPSTGKNTHVWILQYHNDGKGVLLNSIPFDTKSPQQPVIAQATSVSTRVHSALAAPAANSSMVSMEMQVQGEALKFFGATGRAQRFMADDLLAQRSITLGKLLAYAKASAEPDIALRFLEKYFEDIEFLNLEEIPADQWKLLEEFAIRMNGTKTLVPDYCADKIARFYTKKPAAQLLTDLQTYYSRGSQPLMRITLLSALGQKMKSGEQVSVPELKTLWRLGREEVFVLLKYLPKEQRDAIMQ